MSPNNQLADRVLPALSAIGMFSFVCVFAGPRYAVWFSIGFVLAAVLIGYEIGSRKTVRGNHD